ncbi:LPXTG cell wall anchor domain-containing protein [Enterococcus sp. 669A]|uniref:LPXTG cell wall anchor domain-containing protein n=1 Tax=Candidatus Enterococcus moelleringii TaxID=2815325 RepID=A0ABS3LGY8_9ENTE|nr:LPXTG cell wall anchor domain-containing protein [Enterococcus sp. 669A]
MIREEDTRLKKIAAVLSSLLLLLLCFGGSLSAHAVEALPPGMVIGDSDGVYASSDGEYYIDLVDIKPGDVYEKEITIRSLDLEEPFSLGLLAEEVSSTGSINWADHIFLRLSLDGEEIYDGLLLGDGTFDWSKTPFELGVCKYGTDKILTATFTIDPAVSDEDLRERSVLEFYWTFVGTRDQPTKPSDSSEPPEPSESSESSDSSTPTTSSDSSGSGRGALPGTGGTPPRASGSGKLLPQTGEEIVYMFLTGLLLILIALFLWKRPREEEQE